MADDGPKLIRPPQTLNQKVTVGGEGALDAAALERAEKVIADLADSYVDWAVEDIGKLMAACATMKEEGGATSENLDAVFQLAHDIKGQGGSFGYDLMTIVGNQLCRYIEALEGKAEKTDVEVIFLHAHTMQVIMSQDLKGDGGQAGEQLMAGLEAVFDKRANT